MSVFNKQLLDVSVRTQVYIEDVKLWQFAKFEPVAREIAENFKKVIRTAKYEELDRLTKTELVRLIAKLRVSQALIYNVYYESILSDLKQFMSASLYVNQRTYSSLFFANKNKKKVEPLSKKKAIDVLIDEAKNKVNESLQVSVAAATEDESKLWAAIINQPLPVNGVFLLPFLKTFVSNSQAALENLVRKAWANKWTAAQLIAQATADNPQDTPQGNSSEVKKISLAEKGVIATILQHIAQRVMAGVTSILFKAYRWVSVIDGKTSDICIGLNLTKWQFGKGPLPPAHIRCRSHITPIADDGDIPDETFYTWIRRQSETFQNDVLGAANARALREGRIAARDISKYEADTPLSFEGFKNKINFILSA